MEKWRRIHDFPKYEVSSNGEVRNAKTARLLKPKVTPFGYLQYGIYNAQKPRWIFAHRLVVEAFIGPIPIGQCVNHMNAIKTDNRVENLEIVSHKENVRHARESGLLHPPRGADHWVRRNPEKISRGARHAARIDSSARVGVPQPKTTGVLNGSAKLSERDVVEIRKAFAQGKSQGQIAREYGMNQTTISDIVRRQLWRHVP